ncbi:MAG: T9SS type A sorting domain-containing protein [Muribaculaceae bacterium]|nr:T9SS type A sorting domain-containing protein [Muribaculaceae bacterium]
MKKLYSFLASALLTGFAATAQVTLPYTAPAPTANPADGVSNSEWTRATTKGAAWSQATAGNITYEGSAVYAISGANASGGETDSWLVSPTFACKESTEYKITFSLKKSTSTTSLENLDVYLTMVSPVTGASTVIEWYDGYYKSVDLSAVTTKYAEFSTTIATDPGEMGNFYFAFRAHGAHSGGFLGIANITIEELSSGTQGPEKPEQPEQPGEHECVGKAVPYTSTIAVRNVTTEFDEGWSQINGNGDAKKWEPSTGSTGGTSTNLFAQYTYNSNAPDDYLVSPAIHLEAGKEYKVLYGFMTKSNKENVTVYASEGDTKEEILAGDKVHEYLDYSQQTFAVMNDTYTPTKTGDYHFTFHVHSVANRWNIYVSEFSVLENVFMPAGVSGLTATAAPDRELRCTVSWTLPTTNMFGDPFTEDQTIEKVEIFRDGGEAAIATLAGDATTFDDTEATGLTSGKHTYSVVVTVAGVASPAVTSALSKYVGPIMPTPVPAEFTFTSADDLELCTFIKGPNYKNEGNDWNFYTSTPSLRFSAGYSTKEDSWYVSSPVAVSEPGYYRVTINQKVESPTALYKYEYAVGTAPTIEAMTVRADDFVLTNKFEDYSFDFYAAEAGTYYVGVHACEQNRNAAQHLYITSVKVETSTFVPGVATDLSLTPAADGTLSMTLAWTNPTTSFAGDAMTADQFKVEIYVGDELHTTVDGTAPATLDIAVPQAGRFTATVKTVGADGATAPKHPSVTSAWVGPKSVTLPYEVAFNQSSDETLNFWDAIDGNADGKTWTIQSGTFKLNGGTKNADGLFEYADYLLSPEMELSAGSTYRFTYTVKGGNLQKFYYTVGAVKAGAFSADHADWAAFSSDYVSSNGSSVNKTYEFTVEESGKYRIVVAADELLGTDFTAYYMFTLINAGIKEILALPDVATDVTVTPGADYALEAEISWTNPTTTSFEGVTLDAGDITEARIYRNGTEIGSVTEPELLIPGTQGTFTDYELPASGTYTYKVEIYTANGCSETAATEVKTAWIGPGIAVPATQTGLEYGIYSTDNFDTWTRKSVGGSGKNWSTSGTYGLTITSTSSEPDAWAISRPIQFEKNCLYEIELNSRYDYNPGSYLASPELYYGASEEHTELTKIGGWSIAATATTNNTAQSDTILVYAVDPSEIMPAAETEGEGEGDEGVVEDPTLGAVKVAAGPSRLAIRAKDKSSFYVRWCAIRLVKAFTGVDAVGVADGVEYDGRGLRFEGTATVEVYDLAGALVAADARAESTFDLTPLAGGIYIVKVSPDAGKAVTMKIVK